MIRIYTAKYDKMTDAMFQTRTLKTFFEIRPLDKDDFDIYSFFEFIDCITQDYVCSLTSYPNTVSITAKNKNFKNNEESFKIVISNNFQKFTVKVRDGLCFLGHQTIDDDECIILKPYSYIRDKNASFFFENKSWDSNFLYKNSVLFKLGNYIAKSNTNAPFFMKYAFRGFLNTKTLQNYKTENKIKNIQSLMQSLPGYVLIKYEDEIPNSKKKWNKIELEGKEKVLVSCIWIMPWIEKVLEKIHYLEIDASFYAIEPYKYCIFHAINNNSSIPIALSFHPEEESELYNLIFEGMSNFNLNINLLFNLEVLSDMHPALKKFCNDHNLNINFCHRHIIGHFSGHSSLGIWVARLLRTRTINEYLQERELIRGELNVFINKRVELMGKINDKLQEKIDDLVIMLTLPSDPEIDINKIQNSNYYINKWANWIRRDKHIGRCTNHCEGSHANINGSFPNSGKHSVKKGLMKIVNYILQYLENRQDNFDLSFKRRFNAFIGKVQMIVCRNSKSYLECSHQTCNECEEDKYNQMIYGVRFPCIHTVLYEYSNVINQLNFNIDEEVNVQCFFAYLLIRFPRTHFEFSKFNNSLIEIKQIVSGFINDFPTKIYINNISHLEFIALSFLKCFCYKLPETLQIDPKSPKYNFTNFKYITSNFDFNKKINNENKDQYPFDLEEYDFDLFIRPEDTEETRLIKKTFAETKKEIKMIYPSLSKAANMICLHNYIHHLSKDLVNTDESILEKLAVFKIECWLMADSYADSDDFMN